MKRPRAAFGMRRSRTWSYEGGKTLVLIAVRPSCGSQSRDDSFVCPPHLRLLERDVHTVDRRVESQPSSLRMQLDNDAIILVLEIGDRTTLNDRQAGGDRRITAVEIRRTCQIIDLTLGGNAGAPYVNDRNAREFELVFFLVFALVKRAVTPGVADADGDRAAAEPHIGGWYSCLRNRGRRGRGAFRRLCDGRDKDSSEQTQK